MQRNVARLIRIRRPTVMTGKRRYTYTVTFCHEYWQQSCSKISNPTSGFWSIMRRIVDSEAMQANDELAAFKSETFHTVHYCTRALSARRRRIRRWRRTSFVFVVGAKWGLSWFLPSDSRSVPFWRSSSCMVEKRPACFGFRAARPDSITYGPPTWRPLAPKTPNAGGPRHYCMH
jgi:hypothetical protein